MCYSCFFSTQEQAPQYDNKSFSNYVKDAEREKERDCNSSRNKNPIASTRKKMKQFFVLFSRRRRRVCFHKKKRGFVFLFSFLHKNNYC